MIDLVYLQNAWNTYNHHSLVQRIRKERQDVWQSVLDATQPITGIITGQERLWFILNPTAPILCQFGKRKKYVAKRKNLGFCGNAKTCQCHNQFLHKAAAAPEVHARAMKKRAQNLFDSYGVTNIMQLPGIKKQRKQTIDEKYGGNIFNDPIIYDAWKKKRQQIFFQAVIKRLTGILEPLFDVTQWQGVTKQKYNWKCCKCSSVIKGHVDFGSMPRCKKCNPIKQSKGEKEIITFLESLGVSIAHRDTSIIPPHEIDIWIKDFNLGIEYNGLYWHSEKHRGKEYHNQKTNAAADAGIMLLQIWSSEWQYKRLIIESRIKNLLGKSKKIYARSCEIIALDTNQEREFFETNHLQGYFPSTCSYGLKLGEEIVAAMSFSKARYSKQYQWEIARAAAKNGHNVVGGMARLWKYFLKEKHPKSVVSYADRRWSINPENTLYKRLGFTFMHNSGPNYWYTKDFQLLHSRVKFQKKKLKQLLEFFDPKLSETENMVLNDWTRVWDCGNQVWGWEA